MEGFVLFQKQTIVLCTPWLILSDNQVKLWFFHSCCRVFQPQQAALHPTKLGIRHCNSMPLMFLAFNCFLYPVANFSVQSAILSLCNCSNHYPLPGSACCFPQSFPLYKLLKGQSSRSTALSMLENLH